MFVRNDYKSSEVKQQVLVTVISISILSSSVVSCSVAFDGHLRQRNMHQRVLLLDFVEGTLRWFVDAAINITLSVQYINMMTYWNRFVYGT